MVMVGNFTYNTKCILQGAFVVGVWYGSSSDREAADDAWFPKPEMTLKSIVFAGLLFYVTYAIGAVLDAQYGCEHGEFWSSFVKG